MNDDYEIDRLRTMLTPPVKPACLRLAEKNLKARRTATAELREAAADAARTDIANDRTSPSPASLAAALQLEAAEEAKRDAHAEVAKLKEVYSPEHLAALSTPAAAWAEAMSALLDRLNDLSGVGVDAARHAALHMLPIPRSIASAPHIAAHLREIRRLLAGHNC